MKPKILFTASIPIHYKAFHLPYLQWFQEQGYETHVACNGFDELPFVDKLWQVDFIRSPVSLGHFKALNQLKKIIDREDFVLINCHTPMASVLTRLASLKARANGTKLIYVAHGFHFFKGSSLINWLTYYPVEIMLSRYTDAIVCINSEDFLRIQKKGSSKCDYYLIPGIGVKGERFFQILNDRKNELRLSKRFNKYDFLIIYSAEFIVRKNHDFIIDTVIKNKNKLKGVKMLFAGKGELQELLEDKVLKNNIQDIIQFIGFRKDIHEIYQLSDIGVSSSKQEGLPINIIEGMMCGLPIIATVERGHKELIDHKSNGFLFQQGDSSQFTEYVLTLKNERKMYHQFSKNALIKAEKFELSNSLKEMSIIYKRYLK